MALHHFFLDQQVLAQITDDEFLLELTAEDAKHARVLRFEPGEHISVVDAASDYFELVITAITSDGITVKIAQHYDIDHTRPPLVLVQGLAKGDKIDRVVRQATELGVETIIPTQFKRSVVRIDDTKVAKKQLRLQTIAREAAMQSGQPAIPSVLPFMPFDTFCDSVTSDDLVLVCWEEALCSDSVLQTIAWLQNTNQYSMFKRIIVVIGPEGGIDSEEITLLETSKACVKRVSLGPSILRTETAGVVAVALVQASLAYFLDE